MSVILETQRLTLRPWSLDDAEAALRIYGDPEVMRFLGVPHKNIAEQREALNRVLPRYEALGASAGYWAIVEKESGSIAGTLILKPLPGHEEFEIGWHLAREAWGKGYATEAAAAGLEYGFGVAGHKRLVAVVNPLNERSQAVALRIGMTHAGRVRAYEQELEYFVLERPASA